MYYFSMYLGEYPSPSELRHTPELQIRLHVWRPKIMPARPETYQAPSDGHAYGQGDDEPRGRADNPPTDCTPALSLGQNTHVETVSTDAEISFPVDGSSRRSA
jgi:hypothetical protein